MSVTQRILGIVEPAIFQWRWVTLAVLLGITAALGWQASKLEPNAGWLKMVPQEHPYMDTFLDYYDEFGGANRVLVALHSKEGDIYRPGFMEKLRKLTETFYERLTDPRFYGISSKEVGIYLACCDPGPDWVWS